MVGKHKNYNLWKKEQIRDIAQAYGTRGGRQPWAKEKQESQMRHTGDREK